MEQEVSTRVQQALEQIGEDEALTSDLTDPAATALLDWITQQVHGADAAPDDESFQQRVQAIRSAARKAARTAADEDVTAAVVVERAQVALGESAPPAAADQPQGVAPSAPRSVSEPVAGASPASPPAADPEIPASDPAADADSQRAQSARPGSLWNSLRRRLRRWSHRKV